MDQIYIPKNRIGLENGSYVIVKPITLKQKLKKTKPYFYDIQSIEPSKLKIIIELFETINALVDNENIIVIGSFLEKGFHFNDIDLILITDESYDIQKMLEDKFKTKIHVLVMSNEEFIKGLSSDPLYQVMISKCIARKRFVYKIKKEINYKLLDLHLLKSKLLFDNFDILTGNEKYALTRNMIAIYLFLKNKKLSKKIVDNEIKKNLDTDTEKIKQNLMNKHIFLKKYKKMYEKTFDVIMKGIKDKMTNRNKLIELFISNLANVVVHNILEKAIALEEIAEKYRKETLNSFTIAKRYREKINPVNSNLSDKDGDYIQSKITMKVRAELKNRIERGYTNIHLDLIDSEVEKMLREMKV